LGKSTVTLKVTKPTLKELTLVKQVKKKFFDLKEYRDGIR
jgi:hypothetical protein